MARRTLYINMFDNFMDCPDRELALWWGDVVNHGWNAPNTVLSQYIAGVAPTAPGWRTYHVLPQMGGLSSVSQTVPSVKGDIKVRHAMASGKFTMELESPDGTKAEAGIPKARNWTSVKDQRRTGLEKREIPEQGHWH